MRPALFLLLLSMLLCVLFAENIEVAFYYGEGCGHCAATEKALDRLQSQYKLNIASYEVYHNGDNRAQMFSVYKRFGIDPATGGVPTVLVQEKALVIGELSETQWKELFDAVQKEDFVGGVFTQKNIDRIHEKDSAATLTWPVLIGAALVDSINPCTIAIMVMLISAILYSRGKSHALVAGMLFSATIFVMYLLYGIGIMHVITTLNISRLFYSVVTIGALVLAIMEINAYFNYKAGFFAVEMPVWLRPYAREATERATSPLGVVVAAVLCSLFLLPCSSGPYLMVLGMIANAVTVQGLLYLVVYNLLFILPMVVITLLIHTGQTSIEKIGDIKEKYIRHIHLVSGLLLFGLFLLMLNELLKTL